MNTPIRKTFVYTEVQLSVPFTQAPWRELNPLLKQQPGLLKKTWLSGVGNHSVGGFYEFDSFENAQRFAHDYFPGEAKSSVPPSPCAFSTGMSPKKPAAT